MTRSVWLIEDDPDERLFVRKALAGLEWPVELHEFPTGEDVFAARHLDQRPHLILLDLKLPRISGREILAELRRDEAFATVTIIILTGSNAPPDIRRAWLSGCHGYFLKPADLGTYRTLLNLIFGYWFTSL
jgi:CheY-like chemotaxis protein